MLAWAERGPPPGYTGIMLPVVAIVGRPNVGKSTFFNRLIGERRAIVHDRPGVTRDRHYETTKRWGGREILLVDTGGLEPDPDTDLFKSMRVQALAAVEEADVVVLLVDGRAGVTPLDREVAELLRRSDRPVLLAVNKLDTGRQEHHVHDFHGLGLEDVFALSAEHGRGVGEIMDRVLELFPVEEKDLEEEEDTGEVRIAVIGRPNIGKSTLVNGLIGEDRHVVDDAPGTTMDAVDSALEHNGDRFLLVDTAGVRRRSRIDGDVEGFAVSRAVRSIERCHVTLLMVDGTEGPTEQDARLGALVVSRGRALVILVNKWDLVKQDEERHVGVVKDEFERKLPHLSWAPVLYISALTGKGTHRVLDEVRRVYAQFDTRISTADCNRFLESALATHSPPQKQSRPVRLNYMSQVRVRPPTFNIWCNTPEGVIDSYKRFLTNRLRDTYGFEGTPLRLFFLQKRRVGEGTEGG